MIKSLHSIPDIQTITDDLVRLDHGDPEIHNAMEVVRRKVKAKGLDYVEILASKMYNNSLKYLMRETAKEITITDLDTGNEWRV